MLRGRYWAHISDVTEFLIPAPASRDLSWQQLTFWVTVLLPYPLTLGAHSQVT